MGGWQVEPDVRDGGERFPPSCSPSSQGSNILYILITVGSYARSKQRAYDPVQSGVGTSQVRRKSFHNANGNGYTSSITNVFDAALFERRTEP